MLWVYHIFRKFQVSGFCSKLLDTEHQKLSRLPHILHVHLPRSCKCICGQIERRFTRVHAGHRALLVSNFVVLFVPSKVVFPQRGTHIQQNPTPTDFNGLQQLPRTSFVTSAWVQAKAPHGNC